MKNALIYGYKVKDLGGSLLLCSSRRIIALGSPLGLRFPCFFLFSSWEQVSKREQQGKRKNQGSYKVSKPEQTPSIRAPPIQRDKSVSFLFSVLLSCISWMFNSLSIPGNELSDLLDNLQRPHYISLIWDLRRPLPDWKNLEDSEVVMKGFSCLSRIHMATSEVLCREA